MRTMPGAEVGGTGRNGGDGTSGLVVRGVALNSLGRVPTGTVAGSGAQGPGFLQGPRPATARGVIRTVGGPSLGTGEAGSDATTAAGVDDMRGTDEVQEWDRAPIIIDGHIIPRSVRNIPLPRTDQQFLDSRMAAMRHYAMMEDREAQRAYNSSRRAAIRELGAAPEHCSHLAPSLGEEFFKDYVIPPPPDSEKETKDCQAGAKSKGEKEEEEPLPPTFRWVEVVVE